MWARQSGQGAGLSESPGTSPELVPASGERVTFGSVGKKRLMICSDRLLTICRKEEVPTQLCRKYLQSVLTCKFFRGLCVRRSWRHPLCPKAGEEEERGAQAVLGSVCQRLARALCPGRLLCLTAVRFISWCCANEGRLGVTWRLLCRVAR